MASSLSALPFSDRTFRKKPSSSNFFLRARAAAKEVHFNRDGAVTKKLQAGADMVAKLLGVTLGPKGRNIVLQNKYGPPKIVNDGETVLKEIELEDPLENVGVKLVRQAGAKTNDLAGDGSTTSIILAHGLITEGIKVVSAGTNPIQVARGIERTAKALVLELRSMSREIEDHELAHVAAVSAGNDYEVGNMISNAFQQVGRTGVVTIEKGKYLVNNLEIVEGMQFNRGYLSPYFVTDRRKREAEFHDCKLLLVDKKITNPKDMFKILDSAVKEAFPVLIVAEDIEQDALAPVIRNKLKAVEERVSQIKNLIQNTEENFQRKILNERVARLSGGIAIIQVGAQTQVELKDKQLKVEDALNATKSAIEEGIVVGGGCALLRLATKVDRIKDTLDNTEQKIGAEIFKKALSYPIRLIAKNAGTNGNIVIEKVLSNKNPMYGYNAAKNQYEDLMLAGIIDPTKVVRCCLEHAASVAQTFLTSDCVIVEIKEIKPRPIINPPLPTSSPATSSMFPDRKLPSFPQIMPRTRSHFPRK
ncbi:unnamed protein product [Arabidopsis lyrata]|nr:unnamed protein product [Arabidopsis lyrata]